MKRIFLTGIIFGAAFLFSSCKKNQPCGLIAAKIIRYDCDRVIFQLLTDERIGDDNWQDVSSGMNYSNVVSYYNTCKIASLTNGNYDTLYITPVKTDTDRYAASCNQCLVLPQSPPATKVELTAVSKTPCAD